MPFYDYMCSNCGHEFMEKYSISDRNIPKEAPCPKCSKEGTIDIKVGIPGLSDPMRLGLKKPDAEFRNLVDTIKKNTKTDK